MGHGKDWRADETFDELVVDLWMGLALHVHLYLRLRKWIASMLGHSSFARATAPYGSR